MDQVIPLTNDPNQTMAVSLTVNGLGLTLQLNIRFNEIVQYWTMNIADANGNNFLVNIPLITGVWPSANILGQYQYLRIGSAYVLDVSNDDNSDYPNANDLNKGFVLLWGDNV
jgi:hypothetical protein